MEAAPPISKTSANCPGRQDWPNLCATLAEQCFELRLPPLPTETSVAQEAPPPSSGALRDLGVRPRRASGSGETADQDLPPPVGREGGTPGPCGGPSPSLFCVKAAVPPSDEAKPICFKNLELAMEVLSSTRNLDTQNGVALIQQRVIRVSGPAATPRGTFHQWPAQVRALVLFGGTARTRSREGGRSYSSLEYGPVSWAVCTRGLGGAHEVACVCHPLWLKRGVVGILGSAVAREASMKPKALDRSQSKALDR